MKKIAFILALFLFSFQLKAQEFLPFTEDIPQMEGLMDVEEVANFDNPTEKLLILNAKTTLSEKEVLKFYNATLNNLGWNQQGKNTFKRGKDTLQIECHTEGKNLSVQFTLTQKNN